MSDTAQPPRSQPEAEFKDNKAQELADEHHAPSDGAPTLQGSDEEKAAPLGPDVEKAAPPAPPVNDAPDGGLVAWLVVLGAWCVSFCSFGWLNSAFISAARYGFNC